MLGVGDDCALLAARAGFEIAVTTDMLIEGRHFRSGADARALGHKALAVNLSDLAATGAAPRWATLAIALPAADESWLEAFAQGLFALAERYGVDLVGGDTTRGPLLVISITAASWAARRSPWFTPRSRKRQSGCTSPSRASRSASGCEGWRMRRSTSRTG